MSVRLSDVANHTGVSPGLVSKVLNNRDNVRISGETRQRIVNAARELGYSPSTTARSLRSGKTHNVAFVFCSPRSSGELSLYGQLAAHLASFLHSHKYHLLFHPFETQAETLDYLGHLARARTCDLVVLWDYNTRTLEQGRLLESLKLPFVAKGLFQEEFPDWLQIDFDHRNMMQQIVLFLVEKGHRQIAYVGYKAQEPFIHRLHQGFLEAIRTSCSIKSPSHWQFAGSTAEMVQTKIEEWFSLPDREQPTAIVLGADISFWEAIEFGLIRWGRRIGFDRERGDVAVLGTAHSCLRLLFGEALFLDTDFLGLGEALCQTLIAPFLRGEPYANRVHSYLPKLQPVSTLRLSERGILFPQHPAL